MLSQPSGSLNATCIWLFIQQLFTNSCVWGHNSAGGGGGVSPGYEVTHSICLFLQFLKGRVLTEAGNSQPFRTFWLLWLYLLSPFPGLQSVSSLWLFSHSSFAFSGSVLSLLSNTTPGTYFVFSFHVKFLVGYSFLPGL